MTARSTRRTCTGSREGGRRTVSAGGDRRAVSDRAAAGDVDVRPPSILEAILRGVGNGGGAQEFARHRRAPRAAHRFAQRHDLLGVERAALQCHGALLLEDGDAIFDDEIGGGRQRADGREGNDQPRHDADAAEREPSLEAHVLAFE